MTETNLTELRKQCVTSLYLCTENVSKYLDEDKNIEFEKLKSYVEKYCLLEAQQDVATQALEKAKVMKYKFLYDSLIFSLHRDIHAYNLKHMF